jgi:hypothetical protein
MGRRTGPGVERRCVPQRVGAVVALAGLLWAAGCLGNRRLEAASITVVQGNGNTVFDKSNAANEVDFDIIWSTNLPVQLEVQLDAGDPGAAWYRRSGRSRCRLASSPSADDCLNRGIEPGDPIEQRRDPTAGASSP